MFISWDKIDLHDLDANHRKIYTAMLGAQQHQWDEPLNIGIYESIITPLQAGRLVKKALCRSIGFNVPPQYIVKVRDQISGYGTFDFDAQYDRRTGSITGSGNFSWEETHDISASVTQVRPLAITSSLMALLAYSSYGDKERKEVLGILYSNPDKVEDVVRDLRLILKSVQLYPPEQIPPISTSRARVAQSTIAQDGKDLGWLNSQIDRLDQITLVASIGRFSNSMEKAMKDTSAVESAFSNMKSLTSVLERPFLR